jgi:hypothetical protein
VVGGPGAVAVVAYGAMLGFCAVAALMVAVVRPSGPLPNAHLLIERLIAVMTLIGGTGLVLRWTHGARSSAATDRRRSDIATTCVLAFTAILPVLLIPLYFLLRSTQAPSDQAVLYPFVDRRWLVATFLVGTLGVMLLMVVMWRVVLAAHSEPRSWTTWFRDTLLGSPDASASEDGWKSSAGASAETETWRTVAFKLAAAIGIALYFFGPPWGLSAGFHPIDAHETFQLGALEAMANGATPYLGAASTQYGPGSQLISSLYMHHVSTHSVVGFRESFALFQWVAATVFCGVVALRLRFLLALITIALAILLFPTLQEFGFTQSAFTDSGTFDGFFGWFNALRYIGVFAAVMLLPVAFRAGARHLLWGGILGVVWGGSCYIAQENLGAGLLGIVTLSLLMLLTRSVDVRSMRRVLGGIAIGFALIWAPALIVYGVKGQLGTFIWSYFLVPSAVTRGYSNTSFLEGFASDWGPMFYLFPLVLLVIGAAALLRVKPLRIATQWSRERTLVASVLVVCAVSYAGTLLRSDTSHLINTMLAVPVLAVLSVAYLPRIVAPTASRRTLVGGSVAIASAFALLFPLARLTDVPRRVVVPATARVSFLRDGGRGSDTTLPGTRMGPGLAAAPLCCTTSLLSDAPPMKPFLGFLDHIHAIVGTRPVYVAWGRGSGMPGLIYFGAALRPAPLYVEPGTLLVNKVVERRFLREFRQNIHEIRALVTIDVTPNPERDIFTAAYPRHRSIMLPLQTQSVHVLLAD